MNLKELTEFLVKNLVKEPDMVSVKESKGEKSITLIVMVPKNNMGMVIGHKGRIINAICSVVQASSYMNKLFKVKIEVNLF